MSQPSSDQPVLGEPIGSRHSSDGDRTAVPTPLDSRSIREESQSSGSDSISEKPKAAQERNPEREPEEDQRDGETDGWSYGKQLKVSLISLIDHDFTDPLLPPSSITQDFVTGTTAPVPFLALVASCQSDH